MNIHVKIMVRPETNDPQSIEVHNTLTNNMGYKGIKSVRLGKFVDIQLRQTVKSPEGDKIRLQLETDLLDARFARTFNPVTDVLKIDLVP